LSVHTVYELREEIFGLAQNINQFLDPLTRTIAITKQRLASVAWSLSAVCRQ
jgi:hypothetical protein